MLIIQLTEILLRTLCENTQRMALASFASAKFYTLIAGCQLPRKILSLHIATRTGLTSKSIPSLRSTPNLIVQSITTLAISRFYCYNIPHMVASSRGLGHMVFIHAIAGSNPAATTIKIKRTRRVRFIFMKIVVGCEPAGFALSRKRVKKKN